MNTSSALVLAPTHELDSPEARNLREELVRELIAEGDLDSPSVIEAMRIVPRHVFVPDAPLVVAYANRPVSIGREQTISQPAVVALMTEALELTGHERVLEIGTGSGYQAAVLSLLAREVFSVERIELLAESARQHLDTLGCTNVHVRISDGWLGWSDLAPFDRIILTAAPNVLPPALLDQLAEGGILIAPVGDQGCFCQSLLRLRKIGGVIEEDDLGAVQFVEMKHGEERG
jgi:protein-L-isoaspartate(D-aspartate) O-methyltransferase